MNEDLVHYFNTPAWGQKKTGANSCANLLHNMIIQ